MQQKWSPVLLVIVGLVTSGGYGLAQGKVIVGTKQLICNGIPSVSTVIEQLGDGDLPSRGGVKPSKTGRQIVSPEDGTVNLNNLEDCLVAVPEVLETPDATVSVGGSVFLVEHTVDESVSSSAVVTSEITDDGDGTSSSVENFVDVDGSGKPVIAASNQGSSVSSESADISGWSSASLEGSSEAGVVERSDAFGVAGSSVGSKPGSEFGFISGGLSISLESADGDVSGWSSASMESTLEELGVGANSNAGSGDERLNADGERDAEFSLITEGTSDGFISISEGGVAAVEVNDIGDELSFSVEDVVDVDGGQSAVFSSSKPGSSADGDVLTFLEAAGGDSGAVSSPTLKTESELGSISEGSGAGSEPEDSGQVSGPVLEGTNEESSQTLEGTIASLESADEDISGWSSASLETIGEASVVESNNGEGLKHGFSTKGSSHNSEGSGGSNVSLQGSDGDDSDWFSASFEGSVEESVAGANQIAGTDYKSSSTSEVTVDGSNPTGGSGNGYGSSSSEASREGSGSSSEDSGSGSGAESNPSEGSGFGSGSTPTDGTCKGSCTISESTSEGSSTTSAGSGDITGSNLTDGTGEGSSTTSEGSGEGSESNSEGSGAGSNPSEGSGYEYSITFEGSGGGSTPTDGTATEGTCEGSCTIPESTSEGSSTTLSGSGDGAEINPTQGTGEGSSSASEGSGSGSGDGDTEVPVYGSSTTPEGSDAGSTPIDGTTTEGTCEGSCTTPESISEASFTTSAGSGGTSEAGSNPSEGAGEESSSTSEGYGQGSESDCYGYYDEVDAQYPIDYTEAGARNYLNEIMPVLQKRLGLLANSTWLLYNDVNENNLNVTKEIYKGTMRVLKAVSKRLRRYDFTIFEDKNLQRMTRVLSKYGYSALPCDRYEKLQEVLSEMRNNYNGASVCHYQNKEVCDVPLIPDVAYIMASSRNPEELKHYWIEWHDVVGKSAKRNFKKYVALASESALLNGFPSMAEYWLDAYEHRRFEEEISVAMDTISQLYVQLHGYVRYKIRLAYGEQYQEEYGPIQVNLLGDMFGETWENIAPLAMPYPEYTNLDVTDELLAQEYTPRKMFELAEEFFLSMNMSALPSSFWANSILENPSEDISFICHPAVINMYDKDDIRARICTNVNARDLSTIFNLVGQAQYMLQYRNQPAVYQEQANPGFQETIGQLISQLTSTPRYLTKVHLLSGYRNIRERKINRLFLTALKKVAFLPFAYSVDQYRLEVFRHGVSRHEYNCKFWELRSKIAGVEPPVGRSNRDFDPAAVPYVSADVDYIQHIFSTIAQFQLQKGLCRISGDYGHRTSRHDLCDCSIANSAAAGNALKSVMQLGSSKSWTKMLYALTGYRGLNAEPMLEYFQPLYDWLKNYNEQNHVPLGWVDSKKCSFEDKKMRREDLSENRKRS